MPAASSCYDVGTASALRSRIMMLMCDKDKGGEAGSTAIRKKQDDQVHTQQPTVKQQTHIKLTTPPVNDTDAC